MLLSVACQSGLAASWGLVRGQCSDGYRLSLVPASLVADSVQSQPTLIGMLRGPSIWPSKCLTAHASFYMYYCCL